MIREKRQFMTGMGAALLAAGLLSFAVAQQSAPRGMRNQALLDGFRKTLPEPETRPAGKTVKTAKAPVARVKSSDLLLGMNLWHMRLSPGAAEVRMRGLEHAQLDPAGNRDWTPERVPLDEPVPEGELLRLSFESASVGYLYVVDQDVYSDGSTSVATLRFPTLRIRNGNNRVAPGIPVEIPDQSDKPPAFTVTRTKPNQNVILLTLVLSPNPLPEIKVQRDAQILPEELLERWKRDWGSQVENTEDKSSAGKLYTLAEKMAAADSSKPLGGKDPLPLTWFHRPALSGQPMLAVAVIKVKPKQ
jgi:hypothetical protein